MIRAGLDFDIGGLALGAATGLNHGAGVGQYRKPLAHRTPAKRPWMPPGLCTWY